MDDTAYVVENGKMVIQTDIDMNNHKINVPQFITGYYDKSKHHSNIFLKGVHPFQIIPYDCTLSEIFGCFYEQKSSDFRITLKVIKELKIIINGQTSNEKSFNSTQNERKQNFTSNIQLFKNDILWIQIYKIGTTDNISPNGAVFSLVFK